MDIVASLSQHSTALALIATQLTSLILSGDLMGSLIGDAGRFVGAASTFALLAVSVFHTQFKYEAFISLLKFYISAVQVVVLIGIAQHYKLIELPGDHGMTATLGNLDFFAAFVGTSLPLLALLWLESGKKVRIGLVIAATVNIYALRLAGPLRRPGRSSDFLSVLGERHRGWQHRNCKLFVQLGARIPVHRCTPDSEFDEERRHFCGRARVDRDDHKIDPRPPNCIGGFH